ncbi:MAG: hypothetical protein GXZ09_11290 [Syntrophomonadaceae bacterium]|jgi:NaMN:DMB phosphoribosyltransferase|nr:hypothetical protein [Syntrophomonadaceae bacterium]
MPLRSGYCAAGHAISTEAKSLFQEKMGEGFDIIGVGEPCIGNTLTAAIAAAVIGVNPSELAGCCWWQRL